MIFVFLVFITTKKFDKLQLGLLAQMAERGADNAKVVSSILTQTITEVFYVCLFTVLLPLNRKFLTFFTCT